MPSRHDLWHWWHQAGHILHTTTFRWPVVLLCLLLLPLMLIVYTVRERRRSRAVARFGNPALMPNLVKSTPRWRRHLIPVVMLLALASLLVGAARPQRPVLADKRAATIVLAIDTSGSMSATDIKPNRLAAARAAARTLVTALPADGRVGVVAFTRSVHVLNTPTDDRSVITGSLNALKISGGTAIGDAIAQSQKLVQADTQKAATPGHPAAAIVLLSDGSSTEGKIGPVKAATAANKAGIPVYTVSLGTACGHDQGSPPRPHDLGRARPEGARRDREGRRRPVLHGAQRDPAEVDLPAHRQEDRDRAEAAGSRRRLHRARDAPAARQHGPLAALVPPGDLSETVMRRISICFSAVVCGAAEHPSNRAFWGAFAVAFPALSRHTALVAQAPAIDPEVATTLAVPASGTPDVSVVVTIYNEADTVEELAKRLRTALESFDRSWEVVFVDDG